VGLKYRGSTTKERKRGEQVAPKKRKTINLTISKFRYEGEVLTFCLKLKKKGSGTGTAVVAV